jgi:hypothetical protein
VFSATAEIYDEIYEFKDFAAEATKIRQLIARKWPGAKTPFDVAFGTREHSRLLSPDFPVDGIDLEPTFVNNAQTGHMDL